MGSYFKVGCWNIICDVCGRKFKSDEVRERWDGYYVCKSDWESRHPLDFFRVSSEDTSVPFTREEPVDTFVVNPYACTVITRQHYAGIGTAGCMTVGYHID